MENKAVDLLMATYNGGKYIENQLLSLQQQTYKNWILYIQDDGSTDDTLIIAQRYANLDSRIKIIEGNKKGQGAGHNFLSLVQFSQSDYAIFCDQDDIWLENKISEMVAYANLKELDQNPLPGIVYADGHAFSDHSGEIYFESISQIYAPRINDFLFYNAGYQGCSILMNKPLKDIAKNYKGYVYLHDDIVSLIAHAFDNVHFLPKKLMLYRQHSAAVTGLKSFSKKSLSSTLFGVSYLLSRKHYNEKKSFFENYSEIINIKNQHLLKEFIAFGEEKSFIKKVRMIMRNDFTLGGDKSKLIIKTILRKGFDS